MQMVDQRMRQRVRLVMQRRVLELLRTRRLLWLARRLVLLWCRLVVARLRRWRQLGRRRRRLVDRRRQ